jgi:hypothetical protein
LSSYQVTPEIGNIRLPSQTTYRVRCERTTDLDEGTAKVVSGSEYVVEAATFVPK